MHEPSFSHCRILVRGVLCWSMPDRSFLNAQPRHGRPAEYSTNTTTCAETAQRRPLARRWKRRSARRLTDDIAPAGNAAQWLCDGPYLPLKGGGHQHCRVQHNPVLPGLSHPHPKPSAYEASSQLVFLAAKSGRRKIVRGGKDRMLAQPTAGGLHFRERPPRPGSSTKCQVSYDWSWPQEAPTQGPPGKSSRPKKQAPGSVRPPQRTGS
jgi:hypothetical protein